MADPKLLFKAVMKLGFFGGFLYIGDKEHSKLQKTIIAAIMMLTSMIMLYQTASSLYLMFFLNSYEEDGSMLVCMVCACASSCGLLVYYTRKGPIIQAHYKKLIQFAKECSELDVDDRMGKRLRKYSKWLNIFIKYSMMLWLMMMICETVLKSRIYYSKSGTGLFYEVPHSIESESAYWQTLLTQDIVLLCLLMTQHSHRNYLFAVMVLKSLCFQYLRYTLQHIIMTDCKKRTQQKFKSLQLYQFCENDFNAGGSKMASRNKEDLEVKIDKWVENHVHLLSLCKEFIDIYTPLLITYFTALFITLISGVFYITQSQHGYGVAEQTLMGFYFTGMVLNLLMICIAGTYLSSESVRTFEEAFQSPWYECSQAVKLRLKIICVMARRPIRMAAFGSHQFDISLHFFIWVLRAMVTFYLGLVQMKNIDKIRPEKHHTAT